MSSYVTIDQTEVDESKELQEHFSEIRKCLLKENEPEKIMKFDLKIGDYFKFDNNPNLFCFNSNFIKFNNDFHERNVDLFNRMVCDTKYNLLLNGILYSEFLIHRSNLYEKVIKMDRDGFIKHYEERNNIYNFNINEYKEQNKQIKKDIENIGKLKVIDCDRNNFYYYKSYILLKEWYNNEGGTSYNPGCIEEIVIEKNQVQIPSWCNGYHYNADLNSCDKKFEIGDIVELKFKKNEMVKNEYRGKTIKFIINNKLVYKYYTHNYTRLALTPLTDNWDKDDIIIIDDCGRISDLMIDLFPENRLEFQGWECKTVSINVVDKSEKLPLFTDPSGVYDLIKAFKHENKSKQYYLKFELENIFDEQTEIKVIDVFSSNENSNCSDRNYYTIKIITKKDVKNAISFLNNSLKQKEDIIAKKIKQYESNCKLIDLYKNNKEEKIKHSLFIFN